MNGRFDGFKKQDFISLIQKIENSDDRKKTLLKATLDILKKCYDSSFVLNVIEETAFYDNVECVGNCLMEDISDELGIEC